MLGDEPSYREALSGPEREEWLDSMHEELGRIESMGIYELVPPPSPGISVVGSTWVLRKKRDENNNIAKFKSRLCAQGFSQVHGVDYMNTAAPTARLESLRLVLALAAKNNWEIHQIDFKNAYLNGDLDETIYMRQPPGFKVRGREDWVRKLLQALYGLKQAGLMWYEKVCELFAALVLTRSEHDYGVFFLFQAGDVIIIVIHVDDCTLVTSSDGLMIKLKQDLSLQYEIVDLGEARWLLGFEIRRDRRVRILTLSQAGYINTLLKRFRMTDAYTLSVPLDLFGFELTAEDRSEMAARPYARLVGSLMYAAIGTRPDISFAVSLLARFMSDPAPVHWKLQNASSVTSRARGIFTSCLADLQRSWSASQMLTGAPCLTVIPSPGMSSRFPEVLSAGVPASSLSSHCRQPKRSTSQLPKLVASSSGCDISLVNSPSPYARPHC